MNVHGRLEDLYFTGRLSTPAVIAACEEDRTVLEYYMEHYDGAGAEEVQTALFVALEETADEIYSGMDENGMRYRGARPDWDVRSGDPDDGFP